MDLVSSAAVAEAKRETSRLIYNPADELEEELDNIHGAVEALSRERARSARRLSTLRQR